MGNTPDIKKEDRRLKMRDLLLSKPSLYRNPNRIAEEMGISYRTVLRDLVYFKRMVVRDKKHATLDVKASVLAEQYLRQYEKIDEDIDFVMSKDFPGHNTLGTVASLRSEQTAILNQLAELWGFTGKAGINVNLDLQTGGQRISTPHAVIFSAVKDECQNSRL